MLIQRKYFQLLPIELKTKKITAFIGSRQAGKTTLLKQILTLEKNACYITFDNVQTLGEFEANIDRFIERYVKPYKVLCIDEFQYAKQGGRLLKYIHDTQQATKIFISGSSQPEIAIHALQYLVGRVHIIEVFPLDIEDFLCHKDSSYSPLLTQIGDTSELKNSFEEYLTFGGYPEIAITTAKEQALTDLVMTYLHKEIKDVLSYKNVHEFEMILRRLALSDGTIVNKSNLAQDLGINRQKIAEIILTLEKTYIITAVQPFMDNKIKMLVKSPKIYFQDLGIKNSLLHNFNTLELRQDKGTIYENFVVNALLRLGKKPFFWNVQNRHEVDFVLQEKGKIVGIEVKSRLQKTELTPSVCRFIELYAPDEVVILNENLIEERKEGKTKIRFLQHLNLVPYLNSLS